MSKLQETEIFAPTLEELRQIERQARVERAKASRAAIHFVARKIAGLFAGERAADKIRMDAGHVTG